LCSYLYRKPACLVAFLRFNRFACFNPIEPNSEVDTKLNRRQKCAAGKRQLRAAVPAPCVNCSRGNSDQYRRSDSAQESQPGNPSDNHEEIG